MFGIGFWFGLTLTALLLIAGHWAPWPRRLHRLAAYSYGVTTILLGAGLWLLLVDQWPVWLGLLAFAFIGGATTAAGWLIDWALNARLRLEQRDGSPARGPASD
jgi:hypothetical protein